MIIQCEQCDTRFRMADEKLKPGGTKVRCSKCKHVFTVMPPAPEPEPAEEPIAAELPPSEPTPQPEAPSSEPANNDEDSESVDFGSFNMEQVSGSSDNLADESAAPEETTPGLDFSGLEEEMESTAGAGEELADDFSFASTDVSADVDEDESPSTDSFEIDVDAAGDSQGMDFGAAFEEGSEETAIAVDDSGEFSFDNQQTDEQEEPAEEFGFDSGEESLESEGPSEFDFDSEATAEDAPGEFSFDDTEESPSFDFDESPSDEAAQEESGEFSFGDDSPGEYSFDDDSDSEASTQWDDDSSSDDSFDFDEPQFDTAEPATGASDDQGDGDDLQFGEINFAEDDGDESPSFETDGDFAGATMAREEEPEPDLSPSSAAQQTESQPPPRERSESEQITAPPAPRKSPVSSVLRVLGILLLLAILGIGGLAGYFFYMDDGLDINRIVQRFPILEEYVGQLPTNTQEQLIAINISGSRYVNNDSAGQLLVIQGEAVNNFAQPRSAIAVKGILLNAQGEILFQQTVFCGNPLQDDDLQDMSFAAIEEAMDNQFGDSLSNMDVAAASKIPFTIVFRNLPAGIANINVEVVDSKPGGS